MIADGVALVGDAAGYFDPFTGQGIHQALAGAERLAQAAVDALPRGATTATLAGYARAHARVVHPMHRLQRFLDALLARPALAETAAHPVSKGAHWPSVGGQEF